MFGSELLQASLTEVCAHHNFFCSPASPGTKSPAQPHGIGGGGGGEQARSNAEGRALPREPGSPVLLFDMEGI